MTNWRKSSHSGGSATSDCVELARFPQVVGVRDSKNTAVGHLPIDRAVFAALVSKVKAGDLDL